MYLHKESQDFPLYIPFKGVYYFGLKVVPSWFSFKELSMIRVQYKILRVEHTAYKLSS